MNFQANRERWKALYAGISSILIAVVSIVRGLSLFMSARPKTPLRVLCIMAFDTLHMLRHAKRAADASNSECWQHCSISEPAPMRLSITRMCCRHECRATLQLLEEAGIRSSVVEYLRRLSDLESRRPLPGGDHRQFQKVGLYREAVVRLSLEWWPRQPMATSASTRESARPTAMADLNILFRIVMQCQIIDDVLDYSKDHVRWIA